MWPAEQIARWMNGCDEHGNPGEGRTRMDVAFYTAILTVQQILIMLAVVLMGGALTWEAVF